MLKLNRIKYPSFEEVKKMVERRGNDHAVILTTDLEELVVCNENPRAFWVGTVSSSDGGYIDLSEQFPLTEDGYEAAKKCFEKRLASALNSINMSIKKITA